MKTQPEHANHNGAGGGRPGQPGRPFFRRADVIILALVVLAAGAWLLLRLANPPAPGLSALVTTGTAAAADGGTVGTGKTIPLGEDAILHIPGAIPVTLEVKDGAIRFVDSLCPDHNCEEFGWLRREGEWALCAPAGVMVRVVAE